MAGIVIRPRARILHGHDWVFSSELLKVFGNPADGDVISIKDGRDRMLGSAIWNSKSQIVARRFSHRRQELDLDFFKRRIAQAAEAEFEICGVKFFIDLLSAQKTGFYLDQISHYPVVTEFAAGRRVLDCFSNEGAFALICAQAGASEVIGVELQTNAIAAARENAKRNQL